MKNIFALFLLLTLNTFASAQYMVVGKDTISLADFKKENLASLQNSGVQSTIKSTQDFYLLQQFAEEKMADTTKVFRQRLTDKARELQEKLFLPAAVTDPLLQQFVTDSKTEKKVLIFLKEISADDKTDYKAVYNDVISGKVKMEMAMLKYMDKDAKAFYIKPGSMDSEMYNEVKKLQKNGFTKLYQTSKIIAFAQLLDSRPSLGYLIFGTISYPNDQNAAKMKTDIYAALKSGKKFAEVAKLYGSTELEKNDGGLVIGSPTLPDEVYAALKNKKAGEYTEPILVDNKYFVFNIYSLSPYDLTAESRSFYKTEMMKSLYGELAQKNLIDYLKTQSMYSETATYKNALKSFAALKAEKNGKAVLYTMDGQKLTVDELRKLLDEKVKDAEKLNAEDWKELLGLINSQFVYNSYVQNFPNRADVQPELIATKRNLYSEFIFGNYLKTEIQNHPEWLTKYYNENKSKFMWESRADGRVAILNDESLAKDITKEIENPKNWEALQKQYNGKKNAQNQDLINFESGEMSETAEVFTKYKVPFKKGIYSTKMGTKTLVIAVDDIIAPTQMTQKEAEEYIKDGVSEEQLNALISSQRAKTQITVQPEFTKDLEKNFKK